MKLQENCFHQPLKVGWPNIGKKLSEEIKKKISKNRKGKCVGKEMNLINKWVNAKIAANKLGLNYKAINLCLNMKLKTSGSFIWKYE